MFAKLKKEIMAMSHKIQSDKIKAKIDAAGLSASQSKELMRLLEERRGKCMM